MLTPRKGLRGIGMVLKVQESREKAESFAGFFQGLTPRPQQFVVKELLAGPAADCGEIACGDRILAIDGKKVDGLSLQQVCSCVCHILPPPRHSLTIKPPPCLFLPASLGAGAKSHSRTALHRY